MNLIEGLNEELKRNKELLKDHESIGPAGAFGSMFIKASIAKAENAIADGDTVEMLRCYKDLEGSK